MFSDAITVLSILITAASIYVALWQYHRAKKLSLQAKSVTWEDFDHATTHLAGELDRLVSDSTVIYAPDNVGGYIADAIVKKLRRPVPIITGVKLRNTQQATFASGGYVLTETSKWKLYIPRTLFDNKGRHVVVIHDLTMSGDYLVNLGRVFRDNGIGQVTSVSLIVSEIAISTHKAPDLYWKTYTQGEFFFPWGRAE